MIEILNQIYMLNNRLYVIVFHNELVNLLNDKKTFHLYQNRIIPDNRM